MEVSAGYFGNTVELLRRSLNYAENGLAEASDIESWLKLCSESIEALTKYSLCETLTRAEKKKCQTSMTHLLTIKNKLHNLSITGGEIQDSNSSQVEMNDESISMLVKWDDIQSAFRRRIHSGVITNLGHLDIVSFLDEAEILFESKMKNVLEEFNAIKVNAELAAEFTIDKVDAAKNEVKYFNTENTSIFATTDLKECFDLYIRQHILREIEEFQEKDSGWSLQQILSLTINVNMLNPMRGSSYIELPIPIKNKKACVNVKNDDEQCFKWALLSALHPRDQHSYRLSHYKQFANELNFDGIEFPVVVKDLKKFENQNALSVNVYILKKVRNNYEVQPCHLTSLKKNVHVNLLLIQDHYLDENENSNDNGEGDDIAPAPRYHYVWIKNLSALVARQVTKNEKKVFICDRCLHFFYSDEKLNNHMTDCENMNKCKIVSPRENEKILSFENYNRKTAVPYILYADFECLLKPLDANDRDAKTVPYQEHQAYSIGYYVKCTFDDSKSEYKSYRQMNDDDKTPAQWFVDRLQELVAELELIYKAPKPMHLTAQEMQSFLKEKSCHICGKSFSVKDKKVRDHCHLTGQYRGAAHESCNINFQDARFIPVVFHNLTGYDSHFIIKEIATTENLEGRVGLIAENKERYIAFTKHVEGTDISFRFIDSFRFMPSSLGELASYLEKLDITPSIFERDDGYSMNQIELLSKKGVFPYDYVSSFEKLDEQMLPSKEEFYSKLNDSEIDDDDYNHAMNVWNAFSMRTLGEYSDVYLKTDVLLLADVFENFRSTCMQAYGLDPAYYFTTPGLTWDAMLKYTKVKLELLTDVDMLMFVERGIRGGVSQCSNRYAKANNKYMKDYNPEEQDKYLMYYDANNLYGWAMTQYLPSGGFRWVDDVDVADFYNVADDSPIGFILEVDLEYPFNIHDDHKDLPLCPEHAAPPGSKQQKLLTTLNNKERYVIHYRALKQALQHGLILKKVHRALRFKQSAWLQPYVELNTEKRKQSKNEFDKLFFKLMINAVYGKTMENERKRVDVKMVHKWLGRYSAEALIAKPTFHSRSIFAENLVAIQLMRTEMKIMKPIYVGLSVLDISKTLMYEFHYSYMREQFKDNCKMLYTDTDSLIYEICDIDMYDVMKRDIDRFDTSDYPDNNVFGLPRVNKKVIGLMKDECKGHIMTEFIGLRSKMYSALIQNKKPIKKAKGVKGCVVETRIIFEDYKKCLFEGIVIDREQNNIRSKLHVVRTERQIKKALSPHDNKRHLVAGKTDTLPWGHYKIMDDAEDAPLLMMDLEVVEREAPRVGNIGYKEHRAARELIRSIDDEENDRLSKRQRLQ